jgi:peptidoglycan/LPS O-acetylase OafA/YrhL
LAAFAVIGQHAFRFIPGTNWLWLNQPEDRFLYWFLDGVPVFFVLSGLLVYRSAEKAIEKGIPIRQFYYNRFLRVAPLIYVSMLLLIPLYFMMGVLSPGIIQANLKQFVGWIAANLFLVPVYNPTFFDVLPTGSTNGSLWTIPVECSYYVVVPLFVLAARKWGFRSMLVLLFTLATIGLFFRWQLKLDTAEDGFAGGSMIGKIMKISFLPHLLDFGLGIFWLKYWKRVVHSGWLALLCLLIFAFFRTMPAWVSQFDLAWMVGQTNLLDTKSWTGPFYRIFYMIPLSYAVIWLGYSLPTTWSKFTERLGDLSFGVYVWHIVVINVTAWPAIALNQTLGAVPGGYLMAVQAVTLVLAYLSWHLIEKPALGLKRFTSRSG